MSVVAQSELLCPNCAGHCRFDPATGMRLCDSCGERHVIAVDPTKDPAAEFHYDPDLPHTEQRKLLQEQIHQCQTCGGTVVLTGPSLSDRCAYCDGVVVLRETDSAYDTMGMIPFAVSEPKAQVLAEAWVKARIAAPNDLSAIVGEGRVAGIYVPFWTFDSEEAVDYLVRYKEGSGDDTRTRTHSGSMKTWFDDLLAPASPHVTPLIRDGILHDFDPGELRPYTPAYLAGFAAERHHQSVPEGLAANADDKDVLLRNRIKYDSGKSRITEVSYKTHTTGIHYRRILLPVWILHYTYADKPLKIVVCGLHGRTFGERPFSLWKLWGMSLAISAAAAAVGWGWGATGIY